jgi:7-keto-8-aminopelargonate synthetase-like enzyme
MMSALPGVGRSSELREARIRTPEERLALLDDMLTGAASRGLLMRTPADEALDGRTVKLDGRTLLHFGSCSYLGLELDPRLQDAACAAALRYGTQFSSSRTYLQAPLYIELEERLSEMFGGYALMAPSTTLGHLAALPVLVESTDAVIVDQQVHHSVQTAVNLVRPKGTPVEMIRHSDLAQLEEAIERLRRGHRRVWYLFDGIYSMFADYAPYDELGALLDSYEQLHLYADDSHGVGWVGRFGRGPTLDRLGLHDRLIVAGSLNKAFAAAGGALVFPSAELRRRVRTLGGPMIFSGPVQPPMLGAALASARIHLSDEIEELQRSLRERVLLANAMLDELGVPLAAADPAPSRYVMLGLPAVAEQAIGRLLEDGIYANLAMFPAVPMKQAGVRFTLTLHHELDDVRRICEALGRHVPALRASAAGHSYPHGRPGTDSKIAAATEPPLRLEHRLTIHDLDPAAWDRLLGERGTFTAGGLAMLERVFGSAPERPEDRWGFHYYVVRDHTSAPVLATFFTTALWKDDMLADASLSRQVEERRAGDPYYLTSRTFAMGCLLTEGDHLYLDRERDWHAALELLLSAVTEHAEAAEAGTIVLRDLDPNDAELADALRDRGFVGVRMPESLVIEAVPGSDEEWLAGLSQRARAHQRRDVLPFDDTLEVEVLSAGGRVPSDAELDHLHTLYRNVRARSLELNTFELPRALWRELLAEPSWELVLLRVPGRSEPVAFGAHFIGRRHYAPMIIGLDYAFVASHHVYRQAIRRALLRARVHGSERLLLGMGAPLEKQRFGARRHARVAFFQASDHYGSDVLATLSVQRRERLPHPPRANPLCEESRAA